MEKAADEAGYNFSGIIIPKNDKEHYSLSYESFVVPMVKAIQEQQLMINAQKLKTYQQQYDMQQKQIEELIKEVQLLKEKIK